VWRDLAAAHQADRGESENGEDWRTMSAQAD
jgi:hypothetical protein